MVQSTRPSDAAPQAEWGCSTLQQQSRTVANNKLQRSGEALRTKAGQLSD